MKKKPAKKAAKKSVKKYTNGASNSDVARSTSLESMLELAATAAKQNGHTPDEFRKNGTNDPIYVAKCTHCLCHIIYDPSKSIAEGVALMWNCDPETVDKSAN